MENKMENYITVRVSFGDGSAATYDYAAPKDIGLKVGDYVVVDVAYTGKKRAVVKQVLQELSDKTTRGIVGHLVVYDNVDEDMKARTKERQALIKEVNAVLEKNKYAVAAALDTSLSSRLKAAGLL
jgi:uncharacterized protein YlxP (DUF503 family)